MFFNDHAPPHFHAHYSGDVAEIAIEGGEIIAGFLPRPAMRLVQEWLQQRRPQIMENWRRARAHQELDRIAGPE